MRILLYLVFGLILIAPSVLAEAEPGAGRPDDPGSQRHHAEAGYENGTMEASMDSSLQTSGPVRGDLPPYCEPWLYVGLQSPGQVPPVTIVFRPECLTP